MSEFPGKVEIKSEGSGFQVHPGGTGTWPALEELAHAVTAIAISGEMMQEIARARKQHGLQQDAPLGFDGPRGHLLKDLCRKDGTWRNILAQEFFEAVAADGWEEVRAELIQLGAMAIGTVAAGDAQAEQ